jgi:hypothetical protein
MEERNPYCLHPVVVLEEVFKTVTFSYSHNNIFIELLYEKHNNQEINCLQVWHVSTCIGHLQVNVK